MGFISEMFAATAVQCILCRRQPYRTAVGLDHHTQVGLAQRWWLKKKEERRNCTGGGTEQRTTSDRVGRLSCVAVRALSVDERGRRSGGCT